MSALLSDLAVFRKVDINVVTPRSRADTIHVVEKLFSGEGLRDIVEMKKFLKAVRRVVGGEAAHVKIDMGQFGMLEVFTDTTTIDLANQLSINLMQRHGVVNVNSHTLPEHVKNGKLVRDKSGDPNDTFVQALDNIGKIHRLANGVYPLLIEMEQAIPSRDAGHGAWARS